LEGIGRRTMCWRRLEFARGEGHGVPRSHLRLPVSVIADQNGFTFGNFMDAADEVEIPRFFRISRGRRTRGVGG